jgi:hypothetical protein
MKQNIILLALMLFSIISFSQTFEGEIVYSNTYKSKNNQYTDERWTMLLGDIPLLARAAISSTAGAMPLARARSAKFERE